MSFVPPRATASRPDPGQPADLPSGAADDDFRALFREHVAHVWRSLRALGVRDADVADASQQVFLVLNANLARWDRGGSMRALMYGICLRVASDYRRKAHRRHERLFATPPEVASSAASPEERITQQRELAQLDEALGALPEAQREVFVLFEIEELDMNEVAQAVGCPLFTAYSRLRAARKAIRSQLNPRGAR
jgi:RNA polymerase sigma-70 factor (ECF subfamily)